jgi:hypothetical protein
MPAYLSDAWIAELDTALRGSSARADAPLEIETVVSGIARYRVRFDEHGAGARATEASDAPPDIRLTTDIATAAAIARGVENAQIALAAGRLQLGGDVNVLIRAADALATLDDVTAELRARTTFPDTEPVGSQPDVG